MKRVDRLRAAQRGATLIELMVSVVIGMVMTLAIFAVMATAEGRKRTLTSVNDINQAGNVALYLLDKWVRSAGTGFVQASAYGYGCPLYAAKNDVQVLPATAALPAPFEAIDPGTAGTFRLAPVMILPGQTSPEDSGKPSDALIVMSASGGRSESPLTWSAEPSSAGVTVPNTVGFNGGDLLLLPDQQVTDSLGPKPCIVSQVQSPFTGGASTSLTFGGDYYKATVATAAIADVTSQGVALNLGKAPSLQVLGVGDHSTLYSYDLLQVASPALQARAEGVFQMHALYGIDSDGDDRVDTWTGATGDYAVSALGDGSALALDRLQRIKAVRVGLIMRTQLYEKDEVTTTSLKLFSDAGGLAVERTFTADERHYRYRTVEATIPLRNNLLL